jgi:hypothetical protein
MQAGPIQPSPKHKKTFRNRLLPLLQVFLSVFILSTGSGRGLSGYVSDAAGTASFPAQDAQSPDEIWRRADKATLRDRVESASPRAYQAVELDEYALSRALANVPMEFTEAARSAQVVVSLPMPDGTFARFESRSRRRWSPRSQPSSQR